MFKQNFTRLLSKMSIISVLNLLLIVS